MALNLYTNPNTPPTTNPGDWNNFVAREDASNIGAGIAIDTLSLTNWDATTTVPAIAQGTKVEVGGSIYLADSDTALVDDSGLADGEVHIKLVPSGGTVIPTLTSDAIPAWDATKGGWYDSDDKFLPFEMTRSGAITKVYSNKKRFPYQNMTYSFSSVGALDIDGALDVGGSAVVAGGLSVTGNASCADFTADDITADSVTSGTSSLKWKRFSGTTNSSGVASFAHGLNASSVYGFSAFVKNSNGIYYLAATNISSSYQVRAQMSSSTVTLTCFVGASSGSFGSQAYKATIFYV